MPLSRWMELKNIQSTRKYTCISETANIGDLLLFKEVGKNKPPTEVVSLRKNHIFLVSLRLPKDSEIYCSLFDAETNQIIASNRTGMSINKIINTNSKLTVKILYLNPKDSVSDIFLTVKEI